MGRLASAGPVGGDLTGDGPGAFALAPPRPNPFRASVTVAYAVPAGAAGGVTIRVFNVAGRSVRTLVAEPAVQGRHAVTWNGDNEAGDAVAPGIYFVRMTARDFREARKVILSR